MKKHTLLKGILCTALSLGVIAASCLAASAEEKDSGALFSEDFEAVTGNGIGAENQNRLWTCYANDGTDGKLTAAEANSDATKPYVIEGNRSLLIKAVGGDQSLFAIGNNDVLRFAPENLYTVKFLMKAPTVPNDFRMMCQVMSWQGGNWGDEMYITSNGAGKIVAANVVKGTGIKSQTTPEIAVTEKGDGVYEVKASFSGADVKSENNYSSFFRLRCLGATASSFSVDNISVTAIPVGDAPVYKEGFDNATGFSEWGVVTGADGVNFPRGAATNEYHSIADSGDLLINGSKSLVINKNASPALESFAFGNNDAVIRFDPAKRYVFVYDMKTGTLPSDFKMSIQMMSWDAPYYGNIFSFASTDGKTFRTSKDADGAIADGAIRRVEDGHYRIAVAFSGMSNKNAAGKYSSFLRSMFEGTAPYTLSVDDFAVYVTDRAVTEFLPENAPDTGSGDAGNEPEKPTAMSRLGNPVISDNMEGLTKINADGVSIDNTYFNWPFPGGQNNFEIADKAGQNPEAVISGNKSIILKCTSGYSQMITNTAKSDLLKLLPDKTYVASFNVRLLQAPKTAMTVTVRTWNNTDKWVVFKFVPSNGGFIASVDPANKQDCNKAAVTKLDANTFGVAIRFNGIESTKGCYLYWEIDNGRVSFDDFALYENAGEPALALSGNDGTALVISDTGDNTCAAAAFVIMAAALLGTFYFRKKLKA